MTWSPVGSISVKTDWQYTEPVAGSFFRLKHTSFPSVGQFQIARAEFNVDNSVNLGEPLTITASSEFQVLAFPSPAYFSTSRLAIRKVNPEPTLESQLRKVLASSLLKTVEEAFLLPRRSAWSVVIEVSDVPRPTAVIADYSQQFDSLNQQITVVRTEVAALSSQLTTVAALVSEINSKVSAAQPPTPTVNSKALTYVSDGDANGVFYWIGTDYGSIPWVNPYSSNKISLAANRYENNDASKLSILVDRQGGAYFSTGDDYAANSYVRVDLGLGRALICNKYSLKGRGAYNDNHLRNWKLQASNDDVSWVDLDSQANNTAIGFETWFSNSVNASTACRYFRILQTGLNSHNNQTLTLGEIELYGTLTWS